MLNQLTQMGKRLYALRKKRGFKTQKQFAAFANTNRYPLTLRRYGDIERGDVRPNLEEILMICILLRISADEWLFGKKPNEIAKINQLTDKEVAMVNKIVDALLEISPID